jgi:hypothetical protein
MIRPLPLTLCGAALVLCGIIAYEIEAGPSGQRLTAPPVAASPPIRTGSAETSDPRGQEQSWLQEILSRPLFDPSRKPSEAEIRGLPRLTGIVLTGTEHFAIFASPGDGPAIIAKEGTRIGAYEIRRIAETGVTVTGPNGAAVIRPTFDVSRPVRRPEVHAVSPH